MPFLHLALYEPPRVRLDMRAATTSVCRSLLIRSAARRLCQHPRRASAAL